ncbi:MAG: anti-sigma factor RsbA family regulatory protein [Nocardioidaceae bacterium]
MIGAIPGSHIALLYRGTRDFVSAVSDFVREGLEADERVMVIAAEEKFALLRTELGDDADAVVFEDARSAYRPQARSTLTTLDFVNETDRRARVVAERTDGDPTCVEIADYERIEAAANVVYSGHPISLLCPYDAAALPESQQVSCLQTHPSILEDRTIRPNSWFMNPRTYIANSTSVPEPPPSATGLTCDSPGDLAGARSFIELHAGRAGFPGEQGADLAVAASELLTNALIHGDPPRRLYTYVEGPALVFHVHDGGSGPPDPLAGYGPPVELGTTGRGLWMARQLCDSIDVSHDLTGTHARLLALLPWPG